MTIDISSPLWRFFSSCFHQDWPYEASTPDDVLDKYLPTLAKGERERLAALLDGFMRDRSESTLPKALFEELGCYYDPEAAGVPTRTWMEHVVKRLRSE